MAKLIILSIVLVTFAVPIRFAVAPSPRAALRKVQVVLFVYIVVWAYLCLHWYPALVYLE